MFQTTNQEMAVSPTSTAVAVNEDFTQNLRPKRKAYPSCPGETPAAFLQRCWPP
jgi:hypothetical protein